MPNIDLYGLDTPQVWDIDLAFHQLRIQGQAETKRTAERRLHAIGMAWPPLDEDSLRDDQGRQPIPIVLKADVEAARAKRDLVLFGQLSELPTGEEVIAVNDARGARYWIPIDAPLDAHKFEEALSALQIHLSRTISFYPHGQLVTFCRACTQIKDVNIDLTSYYPILDLASQKCVSDTRKTPIQSTPHLERLESESIHIIREAVAEAEHPVMLYSIGKDSSVLLHLARKAFFPAAPPFPLLHVDTRWKFQEMYLFRDYMARDSGMELLVHVNPEAIDRNINPFDHGSSLHTEITKTEGLKQALNHHKFDVIFGGARRDEEKTRAKERIFSFRNHAHRWDPKNQRPELWNLYNTKKNSGESIRVFPLSNWTELDIWQYIYSENIPVVPLYFAKQRPVVVRNKMLIMIDDARMQLLPGEKVERRKVRFRTLGCYPLTGAVESEAETMEQVLLELASTHSSERQGRAIDTDSVGSMEKKKQEGYF